MCGLMPTTHSSGEKDVIGGITPRSNKPLRGVVPEPGLYSFQDRPWALAKSFNEYCKRMEKNDAIIRIAKKLLNRIKFVLKNETKYVCSVDSSKIQSGTKKDHKTERLLSIPCGLVYISVRFL